MKKTEVGILGATGMVGQHFIRFLENHPWFEVTWLGASERSSGKLYRDAAKWNLSGSTPARIASMIVSEARPDTTVAAPTLLFSAMDASVATEIERAFAAAGHVIVSNSKNHRMEPDVPLLVPEVNGHHLGILPFQSKARGWQGQIVTNPNCAAVVLTMALGPLKSFGIRRVLVTTLQAVSGAGYPGVPSVDILGNVIPYISGEEEKLQEETQKILGDFTGSALVPLAAKVSATCTRVAVLDGHMVSVSVELERKPSGEQVIAAWNSFRGLPQQYNLPSAPQEPVIYMEEADRPQPRRDVERERGMACFIGRLRPCPVLDWKFIALGHNTIRGAAGAAVLNAELMRAEGLPGS